MLLFILFQNQPLSRLLQHRSCKGHRIRRDEFWIGIYNENLQNAQGNKKLAQEVLVDRMVHEPEFGKLCDKVGIFWRQQDQDAAGVVA